MRTEMALGIGEKTVQKLLSAGLAADGLVFWAESRG